MRHLNVPTIASLLAVLTLIITYRNFIANRREPRRGVYVKLIDWQQRALAHREETLTCCTESKDFCLEDDCFDRSTELDAEIEVTASVKVRRRLAAVDAAEGLISEHIIQWRSRLSFDADWIPRGRKEPISAEEREACRAELERQVDDLRRCQDALLRVIQREVASSGGAVRRLLKPMAQTNIPLAR